jgi:hypothetical protein
MDMKRILQAMDGVATKPVAGVNDMARFLRAVSDKPAEVINEGANLHKVTLPVQMAMQHYQTPTVESENKSHIKTSVRKFFREVEEQTAEEIATEQDQKRQLIKQYSQSIAERVLMKENRSSPQTAPTVQQDDSPKNSDLNYTGDNVNVIRFLDKAKAGAGSGAKNDFEAAVTAAASMADTAQRQQHTIEQQQERERKLQHTLSRLQRVLDDTNDRFAELTAKVASGEISDQEAALISQEIDKDSKAQRAEIEHTKDRDHKDHDEEKTITAKDHPKQMARASEKPAIKKPATVAPVRRAPITTTQVQKRTPVAPAGHLAIADPRFNPTMNAPLQQQPKLNPKKVAATSQQLAQHWGHGDYQNAKNSVSAEKSEDDVGTINSATQDVIDKAKTVPVKKEKPLDQKSAVKTEDITSAAVHAGAELGEKFAHQIGNFLADIRMPNLILDYGNGVKTVLSRATVNKIVKTVSKHPAIKQDFINNTLPSKQRLDTFIATVNSTARPPKVVNPNIAKATAQKAKQLDLPLPAPEPEQGTLFELSKFTLSEHTVPGHSMGFKPGAGFSGTQPVEETPIAMDPAEPNNPLIHGHQQANPATLRDRIVRARAQLKELAQMAESDDLLAWERITQLAKGGMFMGLEQNLEQIRHAINELVKKRKAGGTQSRGINKNIG